MRKNFTMGQIGLFLMMGALILIGCGSDQPEPVPVDPTTPPVIEVPTTAPDSPTEQPDAPETEVPTIVANPVDPTAPAPTEAPEPTEVPAEPVTPGFSNLTFKTAAESGSRFGSANEVFAVFSYANLTDEDLIRREWFFNGERFITREESWDTSAYGAEGVRDDISIYDFISGLNPGSYRVELYLNNELQADGSFEVDTLVSNPVPDVVTPVPNGESTFS
ncbi:MAG: hypothetical protein AAF633_25485, partial [Chloroflexota bacterium]